MRGQEPTEPCPSAVLPRARSKSPALLTVGLLNRPRRKAVARASARVAAQCSDLRDFDGTLCNSPPRTNIPSCIQGTWQQGEVPSIDTLPHLVLARIGDPFQSFQDKYCQCRYYPRSKHPLTQPSNFSLRRKALIRNAFSGKESRSASCLRFSILVCPSPW